MPLFVCSLACLLVCKYVDMLLMHLHHLFIALYIIHFVLQVLWDYEIMRGTDKCAFECGGRTNIL